MNPQPRAVPEAVARLAARIRRRWHTRSWLTGVVSAAMLLAIGAAALIAVDWLLDLPTTARAVLRWLPVGIGVGVVMRTALRARGMRSDRDATLWVEGAGGDPDHLLTTALEADLSTPVGAVVRRRAEERARAVSPEALMPWRLGGPALRAAAALAAGVTLAAFSPGGLNGAWARWFGEDPGGGDDRELVGAPPSDDSTEAVPRFTDLALRFTPPAYTGLPGRDVPADAVVAVLPGATIELGARATGGRVAGERVGLGALRFSVTESDEGDAWWRTRWRVSPDERGVDLTLRAGADDDPGAAAGPPLDRRVLPLAVLEDRPPEVVWVAPAEDLVVATATGRVTVRARVVDDYGTGPWGLHWVRSSGSGESFAFAEGSWEWSQVTERGDTLVGTLELDLSETGLGPGDVLHLRAEARDRNDVTGPGLGVSVTRQIRVVTEDDLDQVTTLVGFPIEREREPILSQRMIILLTERLLAGRDTLSAEAFAAEAVDIANEQDRLRERIEESMFVREAAPDAEPEPATGDPVRTLDLPGHDHDGSPILDVDPDLLVAFNAMWDAGRSLRQAEVQASLPPQHVALEHLQKLREAERVFARGRVERPPLDLDAARGTGEVDEARPAARSTAAPSGTSEPWVGEIEAAAAALSTSGANGSAAPPSRESSASALRLRELAARLLNAPQGGVAAARAVSAAADRIQAGEATGRVEASRLLAEAARALEPVRASGTAAPWYGPQDGIVARYGDALKRDSAEAESIRSGGVGPVAPFTFATARYRSGDWDSAPLVPSNLAHSLAQYTDLPVDWEGVEVDLSSPELLRYPFVFLTGHLPLRLDDAESANLVRYVERGGFLFIDDHNHDIDGAFHRSVLSELARLFGPDALQALPNTHELYRAFFVFEDGPPITGHELSGWGDGLIHESLFAIERGGRIAVLYSNKDYASEWSYHAENKRFLALDNTRFGVNVLLYALTR